MGYANVITPTYTITSNDYFIVYNNTAAGNMTLPAAITGIGNFKGRIYKIKNNNVTRPLAIYAAGAETISGNNPVLVPAQQTIELISTGTTSGITWDVVSLGIVSFDTDGIRVSLANEGCPSCAAYDAAATDSWVSITAAEYVSLTTTLSASAYVASPPQMSTTSDNTWSAGYTITESFTNESLIPAANYVLALSIRTGTLAPSSLAGLKLRVSNTTQTSGYTLIPVSGSTTPNIPVGSPAAQTIYYFVLKKPTNQTPAGSASNVAIYIPTMGQVGVVSTTGSLFYIASDASNPSNPFTVSPQFQVLATPSKSW